MRTIEKNIYTYNELPTQKAKDKALQAYQEGYEFFGGDEALETIKKGLEHFNFKLVDYSIDWSGMYSPSWFRIEDNNEHDYDSDEYDLEGVALADYLKNDTYFCKYEKKICGTFEANCPFTGVCYDESFLDPMKKFIASPRNLTFKELMKECVDEVLKDCKAEYEYTNEEDYFIEECKCNDYEFYEDGSMY